MQRVVVRVSPGKLALWFLLSVPAGAMLQAFLAPEAAAADLLPVTGEWSARLIIAALCLTPLQRLFPSSAAVRWLVRHRRAFGVAAFAYAMLHLAFYVLDMETAANIVAELGAPGIWTAWLALACLLPPALASNDAAMRALGSAWKKVQRLAYPAAVLTLLHWLLIHDGSAEALAHFAPLVILQLVRLLLVVTRSQPERKIA